MNMTSKQRQITDTVIKGNPDGSWLDIDQLVENVPYETSKDSMHFSLRALIKSGASHYRTDIVGLRNSPKCVRIVTDDNEFKI
jgi:hypothetical protein